MAEVDIAISTTGTLNDLIALFEDATQDGYRIIARQVIPQNERLLDRLIDQKLRKYPPPRNRSRRFVYSHDREKDRKARAWVAIHYPNGYKRTGRMGRAWVGEIRFNTGQSVSIAVDVRNETPGASYVYGSEQFAYKRVPGHITTGWQDFGKVGAGIVLEVAVSLENDGYEALETALDRKLK